MDAIIDHILQFLQFDVTRIFAKGSECCLCCISDSSPSFTESMERCIANVYEPRPEITNGDEEVMECDDLDECDENQLAEFCAELRQLEAQEEECEEENEDAEMDDDDCCSKKSKQMQVSRNKCARTPRDYFLSNLKDEVESCDDFVEDTRAGGDVCLCDTVCKRVVSKVADKCSSSTLLELQCIEERATKLWETLNTNMKGNPCGRFQNWWDLKSWQKLPFYWAALSNEILCEDPFENFKRFYVGDKKSNKRSAKRQLERTLILWHKLSAKQRLPFIMESFISKVGAGKVNIADEHEIQRIICELHNK